MAFWTYIMASRRNGATYVGHTDNLYVRTLQHRDGTFDGHTKKYGCKRLVWAEPHATRHDAFTRERRIKEGRGGPEGGKEWVSLLPVPVSRQISPEAREHGPRSR